MATASIRVVVVMIASMVANASAAPAPGPVTVSEAGGVYTVLATFDAAYPASVIHAVLTDYEAIPRFMPDVRDSRVVAREGGEVVVEQEALAKVLFFSKRIHLRLRIHETADRIAFTDTGGRSFRRYEGTWTLREADGRTVVGYELTAQPGFEVPGFLLKRLLERDARRMIASLQAEIAARGRIQAAETLTADLSQR